MDLFNQGEKALNQKTWFGTRSPDYDNASSFFEQSASKFKAEKNYPLAINSFLKLAECHSSQNQVYLAASKIESAAQLADPSLAADLFRKASHLYLVHGSPDKAADMLEKCAKNLESTDPDACIQLYFDATLIYIDNDKLQSSVDCFKRGISLSLRNKRIQKAIELSLSLQKVFTETENKNGLFKNCLSLIIMYIYNNDSVEARKKMQEWELVPGFIESDQGAVCTGLLEAVETGNSETLKENCRNRNVTFLDNEVARLAQGLSVESVGLTEEEEGGFC